MRSRSSDLYEISLYLNEVYDFLMPLCFRDRFFVYVIIASILNSRIEWLRKVVTRVNWWAVIETGLRINPYKSKYVIESVESIDRSFEI